MTEMQRDIKISSIIFTGGFDARAEKPNPLISFSQLGLIPPINPTTVMISDRGSKKPFAVTTFNQQTEALVIGPDRNRIHTAKQVLALTYDTTRNSYNVIRMSPIKQIGISQSGLSIDMYFSPDKIPHLLYLPPINQNQTGGLLYALDHPGLDISATCQHQPLHHFRDFPPFIRSIRDIWYPNKSMAPEEIKQFDTTHIDEFAPFLAASFRPMTDSSELTTAHFEPTDSGVTLTLDGVLESTFSRLFHISPRGIAYGVEGVNKDISIVTHPLVHTRLPDLSRLPNPEERKRHNEQLAAIRKTTDNWRGAHVQLHADGRPEGLRLVPRHASLALHWQTPDGEKHTVTTAMRVELGENDRCSLHFDPLESGPLLQFSYALALAKQIH